jgi:hypothetical protein
VRLRGPPRRQREARRTSRTAYGPVGKALDDPLVQEFLELDYRPGRVLLGVLAEILDTAADVTGDVLGEQRSDGGKTRLDRALSQLWR